MDIDSDATIRTHLANERTYLAWWRTGLASLAVALAAARLVPELTNSSTHWPYTLIGAGFALLGLVQIVYAERRRKAVTAALTRGEFAQPDRVVMLVISSGSVVLAIAILALIFAGG